MSNLNLPSLKFSDLRGNLVMLSSEQRLAYATTAQRTGETISIRHHGNVIATLFPDSIVKVDTCGYDTVTTSARLTKVLRDNGIPYVVAIRKGVTMLLTRSTLAPVAPLTTATFREGVLI